jgi:succinate dehydrogenase/fumarate reductase flavoprotein subunit/predicted heme/steroid binding protein
MAKALGAGMVDMDKVQLHPTGWVDPSDPDNKSKVLAAELMRGVGGILINQDGERFCDELGTRSYVTRKMLSHDKAFVESGGKWDINSPVPRFFLVLSSSAAASGKKHVDLYTHKKLMARVDGVAELAKFMGMTKAKVVGTLQKYQKEAGSGKDKFGKTTFSGIPDKQLETEVFYVGIVTPVLHYCMGGITIDRDGSVLDQEGNIIPGLHAAGEVTGGVHGVNRLGGNSLLECTVYGTIVGEKIPIQSSYTPQPTIVASSATTTTPTPELRIVPRSELQQHNTEGDCWVAIHGTVYDMTLFALEHPAGPESIYALAGKDGSEAFDAVHSMQVLDEVKEDRIGRLVD